MNRTQKEAWAVMVISTSLLLFILSMALIIYLFLARFEKVFPLNILPLTFIILTLVAMVSSLVFLRRKQSPAEVDYDERDVALFAITVVDLFAYSLAILIQYGRSSDGNK